MKQKVRPTRLTAEYLPVCLLRYHASCLPVFLLTATEVSNDEKQFSSAECYPTHQKWVCLLVCLTAYLSDSLSVCLTDSSGCFVLFWIVSSPSSSTSSSSAVSTNDKGASQLSHLPIRQPSSVSAGVQAGALWSLTGQERLYQQHCRVSLSSSPIWLLSFTKWLLTTTSFSLLTIHFGSLDAFIITKKVENW